MQEGYKGNELYGLLLRATELNINIGRIPQVLFHKHSRQVNETTAVKALSDALTRRGTPAVVSTVAGYPGCYNITYEIRQYEKVSIIIPTRDKAGLLQTAIDSIMQKTNYPDFEVIILNNNSSEASFFELMQHYQQLYPGRVKCTDAAIVFNFAF